MRRARVDAQRLQLRAHFGAIEETLDTAAFRRRGDLVRGDDACGCGKRESGSEHAYDRHAGDPSIKGIHDRRLLLTRGLGTQGAIGAPAARGAVIPPVEAASVNWVKLAAKADSPAVDLHVGTP